MNNFDKLIDWLRNMRGASLTSKILLILAVVAALAFCLSGCTSTRNMSLTIDKAENVQVNMTDSVTAAYPVF